MKNTVIIIHCQFSNALFIVDVFNPNPCPKNMPAIRAFGIHGKFSDVNIPNCGNSKAIIVNNINTNT